MTPGARVLLNRGLLDPRRQEIAPSVPAVVVAINGDDVTLQAGNGCVYVVNLERDKRLSLMRLDSGHLTAVPSANEE